MNSILASIRYINRNEIDISIESDYIRNNRYYDNQALSMSILKYDDSCEFCTLNKKLINRSAYIERYPEKKNHIIVVFLRDVVCVISSMSRVLWNL